MIKVTRYNVAGKITHMAEVRTLDAARKFLDRVGASLKPEPVSLAETVDVDEQVAQRPEFSQARKRGNRRAVIARDVARARARGRKLLEAE